MVRHQPNLPPDAMPWARDIQNELDALRRQESINAQETANTLKQLNGGLALLGQSVAQLNATITTLSATVAEVSNRTPIANSQAGVLSINVPSGTASSVVWNASTVPSIGFTTPFNRVIVTYGALATANGINTSDFVVAHLGLKVNGTDPTTGAEEWPRVDSSNPFGGSSQSDALGLTQVISVTPNTPQTVSPAYGYTRLGGVAGSTTVTFANRYITITPIPN